MGRGRAAGRGACSCACAMPEPDPAQGQQVIIGVDVDQHRLMPCIAQKLGPAMCLRADLVRVLGGDEISLADRRRMRRMLRDHPPFGQVPPLHLLVPQPSVSGVGQVEIGALPVPHLPARVPGVGQDRRHRPQRPRRPRPVRVPSRVRSRRVRYPGVVQRPGDPRGAVPGQPLREHPPDHRRCHRVRFQPVRPPAPCRVRLVRMRPRITEPVSVRRTAAQVPALLPGLGSHRGPHPDPGTGDLPLGRQAEREHGLLVVLGVPVDPPADFRHPERDAVVLEQRRHRRVLAAVERPLILPDHDRVPPTVRVRKLRDQCGGPRAPRPRQGPALSRVEELRHDNPAPGYEHHRLLQLPGPRRHRVLPVLGRHPPSAADDLR